MSEKIGKADESVLYDTIIIGGGCSAFGAAMYAGRFEIKTLVIGELMGGTIVNTDDVVDLPLGYSHIVVKDSAINSLGLFTCDVITKGSVICPVRQGSNRTIAGRYTNHALYPNAKSTIVDGTYYIQAIKEIQANEEITLNYREVINFRVQQGDLL